MTDHHPDPAAPAPPRQPVADSFEPRPGAATGEITGTVALVDGMLNAKAQWGQGILDGSEGELLGATRAPWSSGSTTALGATPAEVWATAMADRYAALVIAAGD